MTQNKMLELALRGVDREVLASNIIAMQPSPIIAERLFAGIPEVDATKVENYLRKGHQDFIEIIDFKKEDAFQERCLRVRFTTKCTRYLTTEVENRLYSEQEAREIMNTQRSSYSKTDAYMYPLTYAETDTECIIPEEFVSL